MCAGVRPYRTRNKSNAFLRQCNTGMICVTLPIITTEKILPPCTRCSENHSNTCAENASSTILLSSNREINQKTVLARIVLHRCRPLHKANLIGLLFPLIPVIWGENSFQYASNRNYSQILENAFLSGSVSVEISEKFHDLFRPHHRRSLREAWG